MNPLSDLDLVLAAVRLDFHTRLDSASIDRFIAYVRQHGLDQSAFGDVGAYGVLPIVDCGAGRFEFGDEDADLGFVLEALDEDGESIIDLVGWPLDAPARVLSVLGRVGLLGAAQAANPSTFFMGGVLEMHETPLAWLKAGCRGAALVTPNVAARMLVDVPGPILAADREHARKLLALAETTVDRKKFVVPASSEGIAA